MHCCCLKAKGGAEQAKIPDLDSLLAKRDYAGAIALLQFKRHANRQGGLHEQHSMPHMPDPTTAQHASRSNYHCAGMMSETWSGWPTAISIMASTTRCAAQRWCTHHHSMVPCRAGLTSCSIWQALQLHLQALNIYKELLGFEDPDPMCYVYAGACYYYMGMPKEAEASATQVSAACLTSMQRQLHKAVPLSCVRLGKSVKLPGAGMTHSLAP